ncbi:3263_t:CDS:2 [Paraglomus occultum]|uniref:3263_t:CDS:1 n=1 Tax=Paraglomus occultum TaxID=144539 RepID=A0A9N9FFX7_9GLOM|nr:3263_t:CDS:2 [Paraglomus occultum]
MKHTFLATSSVLALIIVLALQIVIVTGKNSEHFADTTGQVFAIANSWASLEPLLNCQQLAIKINNGHLKVYGPAIEENLIDLANAVSDGVVSFLIMKDSGDALFRRFKWQIHEIANIFDNLKGDPDKETVEDIKNRLESISILAKDVGMLIKDARIQVNRITLLKERTLASLRHGQSEGSAVLAHDRARFDNWLLWIIDILTGRAATRELRQGQVNEALLQIGNTIKAINNMDSHVARLSANLNIFGHKINLLIADLKESTKQNKPSRAMLEFLIDTLNSAEKQSATSV